VSQTLQETIEEPIPVITNDKLKSSSKNKWKGETDSINQLIIDTNPLRGGVHTMKFKSENDPGGFTVIGITKNKNMGTL